MSISNTQAYIDYINKLEEQEELEDQKIQEELNGWVKND